MVFQHALASLFVAQYFITPRALCLPRTFNFWTESPRRMDSFRPFTSVVIISSFHAQTHLFFSPLSISEAKACSVSANNRIDDAILLKWLKSTTKSAHLGTSAMKTLMMRRNLFPNGQFVHGSKVHFVDFWFWARRRFFCRRYCRSGQSKTGLVFWEIQSLAGQIFDNQPLPPPPLFFLKGSGRFRKTVLGINFWAEFREKAEESHLCWFCFWCTQPPWVKKGRTSWRVHTLLGRYATYYVLVSL